MSKTANWHKAPEILVVDDEADIRELIAGILNDDGYETRLAKDADGKTPLFYAEQNKHPQTSALLQQYRAKN